MIGYKAGSDASIRDRNPELASFAGAVLFGLGGMITGVILGSNQDFPVNDKESESLKFLKRFGLMAGLNSSTLTGSFSDNRRFSARAMERYSFGLYYLWKITGAVEFRPELIYAAKGGNYNYPGTGNSPYYLGNNQTSAVYLDMLEAPLLMQIELFSPGKRFFKIFAGPSVNIPFKGELDEFYIGPMDEVTEFSVKKINAAAYISFIYGIGVKWDRHFSTEIFFDSGISRTGNAYMKDGTVIKLIQDNFWIGTTFSL